MKSIFLTLLLLFTFTLGFGQIKPTKKTKTVKATKVIIPQKKQAPTVKLSKAKINEVSKEIAKRKAYNWLAPFKNYGMIAFENIDNLKTIDLGTGSPTINGVARTIYMSNDSLVHLKAFDKLETLVLPTWTNSNGLKHIGEMTWLKNLYVGSSLIGDHELDLIANIGLEKLIFSKSAVTNNGIPKIVNYFPYLTILNLSETNISDSGLAELKNLNRLDILIIKRNNNITDSAIPHLLQLTQLSTLSIEFTQISSQGRIQLQNGLPNTLIH